MTDDEPKRIELEVEVPGTPGMTEGMGVALQSLRLYTTHSAGRRGAWIRAFGNRPGPREERWDAPTREPGLAGAA